MNPEPFTKKRKLYHDSYNSKKSYSNSTKSFIDNEIDSMNQNLYYIYDAKQKNLVSNFKTSRNVNSFVMKPLADGDSTTFALRPVDGKINLFAMCLRFTAENLHMVDSLDGFPSLVGEILYDECVKCNKFNAKKDSLQAVESNLLLFAKTYPDYLIESLDLARQKLIFNSVKNFLFYCNVYSLNLSKCNLMSLQENLADILKASQSTLNYLNLSGNDLDENFLKKFTLPQRLGYVDFAKLELVDLTDNPELRPNDGIMKYLSKYQSLNEVRLSSKPTAKLAGSVLYEFKLCVCPSSENNSARSKNSGWIVKINLEDLVSVEENSKNNQMSSVEGKFYVLCFKK
jgi:hypothetical protein